MGKYKLIINPQSGKGAALEKIPIVEQFLTDAGIDFEVTLTEDIDHARELAVQACKGDFHAIVAMGGDGTINEVLNGMMAVKLSSGRIPLLGVLPVGRGNDFVYGVNIPADLEEACRILLKEETFLMDVGKVTGGDYPRGRFFGNGIGIGFDTIVGMEAAGFKKVRGALAYILGAARTLFKFPEPPEMEISFNSEVISRKPTQISIMNGKRMGGVFFMAPASSSQDGVFDMLITEHLSRGDTMKLISMITKGTGCQHPRVICRKSETVSIKSPQGRIVCHADGETICTDGHELQVECLPAQIRIISRPPVTD